MTDSFQFKYICKDPVSKYSHLPRSWELGLQHRNFGGGTEFSPKQQAPTGSQPYVTPGNIRVRKQMAATAHLSVGTHLLGPAYCPSEPLLQLSQPCSVPPGGLSEDIHCGPNVCVPPKFLF